MVDLWQACRKWHSLGTRAVSPCSSGLWRSSQLVFNLVFRFLVPMCTQRPAGGCVCVCRKLEHHLPSVRMRSGQLFFWFPAHIRTLAAHMRRKGWPTLTQDHNRRVKKDRAWFSYSTLDPGAVFPPLSFQSLQETQGSSVGWARGEKPLETLCSLKPPILVFDHRQLFKINKTFSFHAKKNRWIKVCNTEILIQRFTIRIIGVSPPWTSTPARLL